MSLERKAGVKKLSQLQIDADKDWQTMGISNLKEVALGMGVGDITQRTGSVLTKLVPGTVNYVLTSAGPSNPLVWTSGGTYLNRYFPVLLYSSFLNSIDSVDKTITKSTGTSLGAVVDYVSMTVLTPTPASIFSSAIDSIDQNISGTRSPATLATYYRMDNVDGAVAEDGGIQSDETTQANSDVTNDMTLLPPSPALGDAYMIGYGSTFDGFFLKQDTLGIGTWTITWKYWDGGLGSWQDLAGVQDESNGFKPTVTGTFKIYWALPVGWGLSTILGMNLYWVRGEVTSFTTSTSQPKGSRTWIHLVSGTIP